MKQAPQLQAVIFDIGRVLVDVNIQRLWGFFFEQIKPEDAPQALSWIMEDPAMVQYGTGQINSQEFYEKLRATYGLKVTFDDFAAKWCDIFSPIQGMDAIVEALSKKVKLGLLSDTDSLHWDYINANYPLMRYFPKPTLSHLIGSLKPSRESYLAAAADVGTAPEYCLFIDDLQKNVDGAITAGMQAVRFEGAEKLQVFLHSNALL